MKRRRNAIPAATEMTTFAAITIRASTSERVMEAPKLPTICAWNRAWNQWNEKPFIGKVRPPAGPWKDRMTMVAIGPYRNSTKAANSAASK